MTYSWKWWYCRIKKILWLTSRWLFNCITKSRISPTLIWWYITILYNYKKYTIQLLFFRTYLNFKFDIFNYLLRSCHIFILFSSKKCFFFIFDAWADNIILISRNGFIIISGRFIKIIFLWLVTFPNKDW